MCTSVYLDDGFFGRTLDYERGFGEVVITSPRSSFYFGDAGNRYASMGVGVIRDGYPMYFDGMNEWGLCGAALDFTGSAEYSFSGEGIEAGRLLAFVLGFCRDTDEVQNAVERLGVAGGADNTPLHWMIADKRRAIVIESTAHGLDIREHRVGVLTNSPSIDYHMTRLSDYASLSASMPKNHLLELGVRACYRGLGAFGLPGDYSSPSRFVRASFLRENTITVDNGVTGLFHILGGVSIPLGASLSESGLPISTIYTSVMDMEELAYYFTTYNNPRPIKIRLDPEKYEGGDVKTVEMGCIL